jgi:hypothetical protein
MMKSKGKYNKCNECSKYVKNVIYYKGKYLCHKCYNKLMVRCNKLTEEDVLLFCKRLEEKFDNERKKGEI